MTFTVTYRGAEGGLREEVVEAANRSECFAQMRARGIVPVSVKEGSRKGRRQDGGSPHGRNELRPSRTSGDKPQSSIFNLKSSIILAAVLAVVGGAWWWLTAREDAHHASPKAAKVAKDNKVKGAKDTKAPPGAVPDAPVATKADEAGKGKSVAAAPAVSDGSAVPSSNAIAVADEPSRPPPAFSNVSDQVISMALAPADGGMPPIPLMPDMEKAFLESLKTKIEILDSDDEKIKAMKQAVIETREQIKSLMDQGQTFSQIIGEHQRLVNENAKIRQDAILELKSIIDSGDIEGAVKYKRQINVALSQMGIKELAIPVTEEERAERDAARLERRRQRMEEAARKASGSTP